jgi:hypothetical protein
MLVCCGVKGEETLPADFSERLEIMMQTLENRAHSTMAGFEENRNVAEGTVRPVSFHPPLCYFILTTIFLLLQ